MKDTLKSLGMRKNWIYESIVSTESNGKAHCAPMGIRTKDHKTIELSAYKSSSTYGNIEKKGILVANLVCDTELFYDSLYLKKRIRYGRTKELSLPYVKGAGVALVLRVSGERDYPESKTYVLKVLSIERHGEETRLFNRSEALALEAIIKSTKIQSMKGRERERMIDELRRIAYAAKKTAPSSKWARISRKTLSLFE